MHAWGDEDVDWRGINEAARYIGQGLAKWGRISVRQYKEKWGTVRVYCGLGWFNFHSITHPGYVYNRYPKWLSKIDYAIGVPIMKVLNGLVVPIQKRIYRKIYANAVAKWPHLSKEILCAADYHELLEGIG